MTCPIIKLFEVLQVEEDGSIHFNLEVEEIRESTAFEISKDEIKTLMKIVESGYKSISRQTDDPDFGLFGFWKDVIIALDEAST